MYFEISLKSPAGAPDEVFRPLRLSEAIIRYPGRELFEVINTTLHDVEELGSNELLANGFKAVNWESPDSVSSYCEFYNSCVEQFVDQWKKSGKTPEFCRRKADADQLKYIMNLCYNRAIEEPDKLNQYPPFSPQVYGETSFELIQQMLANISASEEDTFIDLGSGVGQVVLQVAASSNVKFSRGIEKAAYPSECARRMDKEFRRWMGFFGKPYQPYELIQGDFLSDEYKLTIESSTIVFANNFAFGPELDYHLSQKFSNLPEGARIISSKSFCSRSKRMSDRQLSDLSSIVRVTNLQPVNDGVSWTDKPFTYFVHTIDRSLLYNYFKEMHTIERKRTRGRRSGANSNSTGSGGNTPNTLSAANSIDGSTAGSATPSICGSEARSGGSFSSRSSNRKRRRRTIGAAQRKRRRVVRPMNSTLDSVKKEEEEEDINVSPSTFRTSEIPSPSSDLSQNEQQSTSLFSLGMKPEDTSNSDTAGFTPQSHRLIDDDCSTPSPTLQTSSLESAFSPDTEFKIKPDFDEEEESVIPDKVDSSDFPSIWPEMAADSTPPSRLYRRHQRLSLHSTSHAVEQHFKHTQRVYQYQLEYMRRSSYLELLRESIKHEEIRRNELMSQVARLEASLNEIQVHGREQFKGIMQKYGIFTNSPTAFFTEARQLIRFHRSLQSTVSELQDSIHHLTDISAELLKRHLMLDAQLRGGNPDSNERTSINIFRSGHSSASSKFLPPPQLFPEPEMASTPPPTLAPTTDEDLPPIADLINPPLAPPTLTPIPGNLGDDLEVSNSTLAVRNYSSLSHVVSTSMQGKEFSSA